ncbi:chondroitin sulfate N-acetylgalactosaminyltransferase 1-like [Hydractinia symbiolongicarpus]|uniref:chondroitin sulfate N-acetylgalactosaminyltransferase 1-like n=1 Tax=Hydractinia symbiolongicarpus TaxID=13093 RepID=UPI00255107DC|nr:chondroitin sulfate N-acetylgalactosaminyltransferase 1-like [Hydractinia symbiolongicarpus]
MVRLHRPMIIRVVLGFSICFVFLQILLLICNCRCSSSNEDSFSKMEKRAESSDILQIIKTYKEKIETLTQRCKELEKELQKHQKVDKFLIAEDLYQNKKSLNDVTFLNSFYPRTEFEVIPYDSFTSQHISGEIGYLSKRPHATPIGQRFYEMHEVSDFAVKALNHDVESMADRMGIDTFVEGITRNDRTHGTIYDLYFRSTRAPNVFKRLKIVRPFGTLEVVGKPETIETSNEWINIILPLSGRFKVFKSFMERFVDTCIRTDRRIFLTIVYFGHENKVELKDLLLKISKQEGYDNYKVIFSDEDFSRGRGIQKGVESWSKGNVLMFFCDVDVYFTVDFLERCRLHTSPSRKIYYPIVFSQYNPVIVFGGQEPPPLRDQMYLTYDSGFWRDFGFGMTCQYRDDFLNVGGFDLSIKGWGGEDVALYKQHLRSKLTIIRAYDRGILHIYHEKNCRKTLSDAQFISCLQSKAVSEGSHKQLGMLAFGSSLISGTDPDWAKRLQASLTEITKKENEG